MIFSLNPSGRGRKVGGGKPEPAREGISARLSQPVFQRFSQFLTLFFRVGCLGIRDLHFRLVPKLGLGSGAIIEVSTTERGRATGTAVELLDRSLARLIRACSWKVSAA